MIKIKITIEADGDITDMIAQDIATKSAEVLYKAANAVSNEWKAALTEKYAVYGLERPQPGFVRGVQMKHEDENTYIIGCYKPYSSWMKYQESAFDYKQTHPFGTESRVGKDGTPYLIIPFRRYTPHSGRTYQRMTTKDNEAAKKMSVSKTTDEVYYSPNARGESIQRSIVEWGGRLKNAQSVNDRNMISVYGTNGKREYYTFRVISAKSPINSWIRKPRPTILDQLEKNISLKDII